MSTKRIIRGTFQRDILNSVLSETPPELLYHYTNQGGLLGIVKDKEIWATHHQCLNDTQEFLHAKGLIRDEIETRCEQADDNSRPLFEAMRSTLDGRGNEDVNLYVASFSEDRDSLPQWRAYGGHSSGFALGFWGGRLALPAGFTLVRCIYEPEKQCEVVKAIVAEAVELALTQMPDVGLANAKMTAAAFLRSSCHTFAPIFKHHKFRDEREWRIVSRVLMDFAPALPVGELENKLDFREGKSMLVPYRRVQLTGERNNLPLHEVVVGPNPSPEPSVRSVQSLLNSQGLVAAKVLTSDIPYRNW